MPPMPQFYPIFPVHLFMKQATHSSAYTRSTASILTSVGIPLSMRLFTEPHDTLYSRAVPAVTYP